MTVTVDIDIVTNALGMDAYELESMLREEIGNRLQTITSKATSETTRDARNISRTSSAGCSCCARRLISHARGG